MDHQCCDTGCALFGQSDALITPAVFWTGDEDVATPSSTSFTTICVICEICG